jgi:hypothetical protein
MKSMLIFILIPVMAILVLAPCVSATKLSDKDIDNLVRRSYQYVAMYNVINKSAMDKKNPMDVGMERNVCGERSVWTTP